MEILILTHYIATLIMTGAIWLAQLSQYPLLAYVGRKNFIRYEHEHIRRISNVAWFIIYIELFTGAALFLIPSTVVPFVIRAVGLVLIGIIWGATYFVQYPLHKKLENGFVPALHKKLVRTNWIRTISWTLRAILWTAVLQSLVSLGF